mgnify:CR=1 FL=1
MERQLAEKPPDLIPGTSYPKPKNVVPNTSIENSGITFSIEPKNNVVEGQAELEVLKCILCREGYLNRLHNSAKTVGKKFKPEVADILDLVRAASVDLIEAIVRWREAKVIRLFAFCNDIYTNTNLYGCCIS